MGKVSDIPWVGCSKYNEKEGRTYHGSHSTIGRGCDIPMVRDLIYHQWNSDSVFSVIMQCKIDTAIRASV